MTTESSTEPSNRMHVLWSPTTLKHDPPYEFLNGERIQYLESPKRVNLILAEILKHPARYKVTEIPGVEVEDEATTLDALKQTILRVHSEDFYDYVRTAFHRWTEADGERPPVRCYLLGRQGVKQLSVCAAQNGVIPETFPHPSLLSYGKTDWKKSPIANAGAYCFDLSCAITEETYAAVLAAVKISLSAVDSILSPENPAGVFTLARPPGHHAGIDVCGGYCFFNNVAIAVRYLQKKSEVEKPLSCKVAILDIDYHHGNGTQQIFYEDPSVLYVSIHAENDYPYFTGSSEETGKGAGEGFNINYPLPHYSGEVPYLNALQSGISRIKDYDPGYIFVSLGVDTYVDDPICKFELTTSTYHKIGRLIRSVGRKTIFAMEGGYNMENIGQNVVGVLDGFLEG
ncbi:Arginase/deacetylase [Sistotremastrum niveocremeum HHB9708]|uniref:Arginase/deacetylase n=2 Tax=Sistotremastraceae TaxID=3402574 RepID=A0A164PKI0_9AGAM|nr:Arginase/deacetylase [Sistotremastrum niveocremeum HHB9708]KZT35804.1 Arginase/deacetylase [Sistotremastrum suecicum HHB10207 ss-3]